MTPDPGIGDDCRVLLILAGVVAAWLVFGGPLFKRRIRHRDGESQHHWVLAGPWEITGLAILFVIFVIGIPAGGS
jgi:hypothetical protein